MVDIATHQRRQALIVSPATSATSALQNTEFKVTANGASFGITSAILSITP